MNELKMLQNKVIESTNTYNKAYDSYYNETNILDEKLDNGKITEEECDKLDIEIYERLNIENLKSEKSTSENELINYCNNIFSKSNREEIKNLFENANKNVIIKDKLVKFLLNLKINN